MRYGRELGERYSQRAPPRRISRAWTSAQSTERAVAPPDPPANAVRRDRLLVLLDAAVQRPLTIVVAPAGYGKTVLVSQWLASRAVPVRWISVTPEHND